MEWYLGVLKKYAAFDGRARRKEYWMFLLFNLLAAIVVNVVGALIKFPFLGALYSLAVLLPGLAVSIRRLHDTSKSGWWMLVAFVPLVGLIVLLYFFAQEGTPGSNEYGHNPKELSA